MTYDRGLRAEKFAVMYLRLKGYKILRQRYKTPVGEVDIIAQRKKQLIFIEVKARPSEASALESITPKMRERIERTAAYFLMKENKYNDYAMRFDLIAVTPFSLSNSTFIKHLDNAWRPTA